jgi:hypothetical protein
MQATRTHGPCTLPTGRPGLGDPAMPANLPLACRTPVFHDLVPGRGVGEGQDGDQDRLATQAFVARWDPDTGERQGGPGAKACTHRSRPRSGGPFSRSGQSTPPWKGPRCDAQGAYHGPPRSCTPGGCSPPAADTTGGHRCPSKVMLDSVRQGTPCFCTFPHRAPLSLRFRPLAACTWGHAEPGGMGVQRPVTRVCMHAGGEAWS